MQLFLAKYSYYCLLLGYIQLNALTQFAAEGENVTFNCTVTGTHPFTVMWLNDTKELITSSNITNMDTVTLLLNLQNVTSKDYRNYTCVGSDNKAMTSFVSAYATLSGKLIITTV